MKKVLFTATVDSHILQFHLPFLKLFKDNGYEVHVATNGNEKIPYCDVKHVVSFERSPFKLNNLKAIRQLRKIINEEKFDIIHTHTPMGSVVTRLAAKNARKKYHTRVIYTAHGLHFFKGAPLKNWLVFYPVEKYLSKYTDTLILINQEDYNLCKRKFKKCKDIQYVPGVGIDEAKFDFEMSDKEKHELRKSLGLKDDDFVMIYPAEISKRKRQIWLIEAINDLLKKNSSIHLLLPGKDSLNGKCQQLVKELSIEKQVHFLGYRKDIPKLLKISNLAISSANQEGLPVNIMEAMYVGLPIVASDCRGNRDLVHNHVNGYLIGINDNASFSESIYKLYQSKLSNNNFSIESKNIIKEYLLDKIICIISNIYFKKKKVLHVLSSNIYSGAENVACTIIENMNDEYDMYYCSRSGNIDKVLEEKNIKHIKLSDNSMGELNKIIKKLNPNIIHAHDYKAGFKCSLLKKKAKLIVHLHNNAPWLKKINLYSLVYLYTVKRADSVIVVSKSIINEFSLKKFINKKIIDLGNPVDRSKVLKNIESIQSCESKKYDICCVARLSRAKNPIRFLQIILEIKKSNPSIKAVWVGDGEMLEDIQNKCKDLGLKNNIDYVGFKSNPYSYMNDSKIFMLTSDWEGYGLVAFEALSLGLPCIVSNVGGLPKIVDDSCGILCNNDGEFSEFANKLLNDKRMLEKFSLNSIKKSETLDNVNKYFKELKKIYDVKRGD